MPPLHRRQFLELGAAAMTVSLAGCFGSTETPRYAEWIPASDGQIRTAYLDFSISSESSNADQLLPLILPSDENGSPRELLTNVSGLDTVDDPLLTWPIKVGGPMLAMATLGIGVAGLGYLLDPERPTRGIDELFVANDVVVGVGEIDLDEAEKHLQSGTDGPWGDIRFEKRGEIGEFARYDPTTGDQDSVLAISETGVLIADTGDQIRNVIRTSRGDHARAATETGPFQRLVETVGAGHIVAGWTGPVDLADFYFGDPKSRPASDLIRSEDDVLSSVTFSPEDEQLTADLALQRTGIDDTVRERIESHFGAAGEEASVSVENDRVTATGTYTNDVLDFEFTEPGGGTDSESDRIETIDPPQEVASVVPDDAVEFTYEPEQDRVKVEFVTPFQADSVTVSAVESEYEAELSGPDNVNFIYAYIDPDGDQVVVTVTVDGVSGVVAAQEFP